MFVSSNNSSANTSVSLTGTGAAGTAALTLEASGLVFNHQSCDYQQRGADPVCHKYRQRAGRHFQRAGQRRLSGDGMRADLNPGGACSVRVTFTPTAAGRPHRHGNHYGQHRSQPAQLHVDGNRCGSCQHHQDYAHLTGLCRSGGGTDYRAGAHDRGYQYRQRACDFDRVVESGDFRVTSNGCTTLAFRTPPATCNISVVFTPTATGARTGSITLTDNATGSPQT